MRLAPLAEAETADKLGYVGVVELLCEGRKELLILLLEHGVVRIRRPALKASSLDGVSPATRRTHIFRREVVVLVFTGYHEGEGQLHAVLLGDVTHHAETLCGNGVVLLVPDGFVPDVLALARLEVAPRAAHVHRAAVHEDVVLALGRVKVGILLFQVVNKAVAKSAVHDPALHRVNQLRLVHGVAFAVEHGAAASKFSVVLNRYLVAVLVIFVKPQHLVALGRDVYDFVARHIIP